MKSDTAHSAKIQAQLEYIGKGVDDIRIDLKANEKQMISFINRVVDYMSTQSKKEEV